MTLSLAMIVKNESRYLAHCLDSVRDLVDEMVVLDTGSTDDTAAIARERGAKVIPFTWTRDFGAARNASLAACTGDWILVLDADEAIDRKDHAAIRQAMLWPMVHGYRLWMREYMRSGAYVGSERALQRNTGDYEEGSDYGHLDLSRRLRLFRRQDRPVYSGKIHELADDYFEGAGLLVQDLDAAIHHFGKVDWELDLAKQAEYLALAREEASANGGDPRVHWNVLQEALLLDAWETVLEAAQRYLVLRSAAPQLVYVGAATALHKLGRPAEALPYLEAILRKEPQHAPALVCKGEVLWALDRIPEAKDCLTLAMTADPGFSLSYLRAARLLAGAGELEVARQVLEAGLDQNPKDIRLWEALVGHSARHQPTASALDAWNAILACPDGGKGIWHLLVIHELLRREDSVGARHVLDMAQAVFPDQPELMQLRKRLS